MERLSASRIECSLAESEGSKSGLVEATSSSQDMTDAQDGETDSSPAQDGRARKPPRQTAMKTAVPSMAEARTKRIRPCEVMGPLPAFPLPNPQQPTFERFCHRPLRPLLRNEREIKVQWGYCLKKTLDGARSFQPAQLHPRSLVQGLC